MYLAGSPHAADDSFLSRQACREVYVHPFHSAQTLFPYAVNNRVMRDQQKRPVKHTVRQRRRFKVFSTPVQGREEIRHQPRKIIACLLKGKEQNNLEYIHNMSMKTSEQRQQAPFRRRRVGQRRGGGGMVYIANHSACIKTSAKEGREEREKKKQKRKRQ